MSCHSLLACRVSAERSAVNLMGIPLCLFVVFPLLLLMFVLCIIKCFKSSFPKREKHLVKDCPIVVKLKVMMVSEDLGWSWNEMGDLALSFAED